MNLEFSPGNIEFIGGQVEKNKEIALFIKGYIVHKNKLHFGNEAIEFVMADYLGEDFVSKVKEYNGCWQILLVDHKKECVLVINDRWGTYPLFKTLRGNSLFVSDHWQSLTQHTQKQLDQQGAYEMACFGYVMGNRTLIEGIDDFSAHAITRITVSGNKFNFHEEHYWHLKYTFQPADIKEKEREFATLWEKQMDIYAEAIRRVGNACYIPMSGGLDSRLLAHSFDRRDVDIYAMTFGAYKAYGEIESALEVVSALKHTSGHYIQYLNQDMLERLAVSLHYPDRITCGYFGQLYLDYYDQIRDACPVIMPGFSGDFMGGSLIRSRMLSWETNQDAIDYILTQRSAPMVKVLNANPDYKPYIDRAIQEFFPAEDDVISNYVRWFLENDIRRYLIRAVINENHPSGYLVLPFFDYELIDFFLALPKHLLINKRLYVNTQIKYLYKDNPDLLKIKRAKPKEAIKPIRSLQLHEYGSKIKNKLRNAWVSSKEKNQWNEQIDWRAIYHDFTFPEWLDPSLVDHSALNEKPTYIKFFNTVSSVYAELNHAENSHSG